MARPREFDEGEVLDKALATFWSKGFDATSIQDLVLSTGLARASLYGAFGDKHRLYERVLSHYAARMAGAFPPLDPKAPLRESLEQLFGRWIGLTCPKAGPRGCFLALAGTQDPTESPFAREALAASLHGTETLLVDLLRSGKARGELSKDRDPAALARLLVILAQGMAACARAGWGPDCLRSAVHELMGAALAT